MTDAASRYEQNFWQALLLCGGAVIESVLRFAVDRADLLQQAAS